MWWTRVMHPVMKYHFSFFVNKTVIPSIVLRSSAPLYRSPSVQLFWFFHITCNSSVGAPLQSLIKFHELNHNVHIAFLARFTNAQHWFITRWHEVHSMEFNHLWFKISFGLKNSHRILLTSVGLNIRILSVEIKSDWVLRGTTNVCINNLM